MDERWVDVSHEALIRSWPQLRHWIDEDRAGLRVHRRLTEAAQEWQRLNRNDGVLYRSVRLAEAVEWQGRHETALNELERAFLDASVRLRERDERHQRRIIQAAVGLAVVFFILAGLATWQMWEANVQRGFAETQRQVAWARQLVAQAQMARDTDKTINGLVHSVLLATESLRLFPSLEGDQALRAGLVLLPRSVTRLAPEGVGLAVALSPEGTWLATSTGQTVRVREVTTGREMPAMEHEAQVKTAVFSPEGTWLATSTGQTVRIWEVATGRAMPLITHENGVTAMALSAAGKWLATSSGPTGRVWEVASGREMYPLEHQDEVTALAFSPDGQWVASASGTSQNSESETRIWEVASGREVAPPIPHRGVVHAIAFSPDGQWVALGSGYYQHPEFLGEARIWEVASREGISQLLYKHGVNAVAFSPDGRWLATAGDDENGTTHVYEIDAKQRAMREMVRIEHEMPVVTVHFSPENRWLATRTEETIQVWEVALDQEVTPAQKEDLQSQRISWQEHGDGSVEATSVVVFSPDGRWIVSRNQKDDGTTRVWEVATRREIVQLAHQGKGWAIAFSPDGTWLATSSTQNVRVWDVPSTHEMPPISQADANFVAFHANGTWLVTGSEQAIRVWEVTTGREVSRLTQEGVGSAVALSPDGKLLATSSAQALRVWEVTTGRELSSIPYEGEVRAAAFSRDGKRLALASHGHTVRVWEVAKGQEVARLEHDESAEHLVGAISFSPNGTWLATISGPTARVWEVATQLKVAEMSYEDLVWAVTFSPNARVYAAAFDLDGQWVNVGSRNGTTQGWLLWPEALRSEACARLTPNLTYKKWQRYLRDEPLYSRTCPDLPAHPSLMETGQNSAREGRIEEAIAIFRRVQELAPTPAFDPAREARKLAASGKR